MAPSFEMANRFEAYAVLTGEMFSPHLNNLDFVLYSSCSTVNTDERTEKERKGNPLYFLTTCSTVGKWSIFGQTNCWCRHLSRTDPLHATQLRGRMRIFG